MDEVHYSSDKMDWGTPDSVIDPLYQEFDFTLDVCAVASNACCDRYISPAEDGLEQDWSEIDAGGVCWMNPPYGRELKRWIQKAYDEKANGVTTVCLVPARTDTQWWAIFWDHEYHGTRDPRDEVRFIKGRIKFEGAEHGAPFPSAIIVLRGLQ